MIIVKIKKKFHLTPAPYCKHLATIFLALLLVSDSFGQAVAAFTPSSSEICIGSSITFANNSSVASGPGTIDSSFWNFGDGSAIDTSITLQPVSHQYTTAGIHTVTLFVKSIGNGSSNNMNKPVTIDALPIASFNVAANCNNQTVSFTDASNGNGGTITNWNWNFGDGNTGNAQNPSHVYTNGTGNSYTATLTVTTQVGCSSITASKTFIIGAPPNVQFNIATNPLCGPNVTVTFNNTSTDASNPANPLSFVWQWGDGSSDSVIAAAPPPHGTVTHFYARAATYTVSLIAVSNVGCTNTFSAPLVINPLPIATLTAGVSSICLSDTIVLTGANNVQSNWNFGDGTDTTGQNISYIWKNPGKYALTLIVTSPQGCQSQPVTDSILVNALPVAGFLVQDNLPTCSNDSISFTDASTAPVGSVISQWNWFFGDGFGSNLQNPSHIFPAPGTYEVYLQISDGCNSLVDSTSVTIHPAPVTDFKVTSVCLPASTQFTDLSSVADGTGIDQETWNFGDGLPGGIGDQTIHQYQTGGVYPVTLTVLSGYGCSADTTIIDTAYNIPIAKDSIANAISLCSNQPVVLIDQSSVTASTISEINIVWDNSQNINTTITNPVANGTYTHQYPILPVDKTYSIIFTAYSGNACPPNSPDTTLITVHASPNAKFSRVSPVCQELAPFVLTNGFDANNLPGSGFYSGSGIENDSVTFNPQSAGPGVDYPIVFTYLSSNGCSDTAQQSITIYPTPSVNYGSTRYVLENDSITLNPVSVSGIGLQYMWTPSLYLNNDTSPTPLCKPNDSITYTITVTTPGGCHASTNLFVQVLTDFIVPNTFTPNGDGINDTWVILELPNYPFQQVDVYDRYGQLVFHSTGYSHPWDGTFKGKPLGVGTYYYIIQLNGLISPKTGYVTILK